MVAPCGLARASTEIEALPGWPTHAAEYLGLGIAQLTLEACWVEEPAWSSCTICFGKMPYWAQAASPSTTQSTAASAVQ
jgi:hypothetical protein